MTLPRQSSLALINRRNWLLWAATFAVLLAMTATVPVLYAPLLARPEGGEQLWIRDIHLVAIGLGIAVLLFCAMIAVKQKDLNRIRGALHREQSEVEDMRTRLSELSSLFGVSTTLNQQFKLEVILEIIVRRVVSTLSAQQASIMIYNPETSVLETRASYGLESEYARHARQRLGEGIAGWVAQRQEAVLLGAEEQNQVFRRHYKRDRNITSALSLPLRVGDRCVGVLNVNRINHPSPFQEHHRDMLRLFSEHVGSVIERAEAMERLAARTQTLEASNLQLSETSRMKDSFLSTASHELKTPLTSVIAYAEMLRANDGKISSTQREEFLRRLHNEANTLLGLIDDILDLSRLENGKLTLEKQPCSVPDLVRAALDTALPLAEKHQVRLEGASNEALPELSVDGGKMRQVIVNLVVNAIKFSPQGSTVKVGTRLDDGFVVVEVRDQGPGIRPEDLGHIFELFGQGVRQSDRRPRGLGIGLHLVKRITELHGGHVGVTSTPGEGSTFSIRVPAAPAVAQGEPLAQAA